MKQKKKEPSPKRSPLRKAISFPDKRMMLIAGGAAAFIPLARGIAGLFPEARLWGLNYLAFLPTEYVIVLLIAGVILATPACYRAYISLSQLIFGNEKRTRTLGIIFAIAAGCLFWFLRMRTFFLGDGASYLAEQFRFIRHASISTDVLFGGKSAPLTGVILAYVARAINNFAFLREHNIPGPFFTFWIFGVACGIVYVIGCLRVARTLFESAEERFGTFMIFLFTPGVLFYFGYVEYYTFYFTCIFFYFFLAARALEGKASVRVPVLLLALSTAFHLMSLVALPSLLFLLLSRSRNEKLRRFAQLRYVAFFIAAVLLLAAVVYFTSGMANGENRNIMSLLPYHAGRRIQNYTLLSSYHLIDFANFLFLISAPVLIGFALLFRRDTLRHAETLFAFINIVFFASLAFFGNTSFGFARDWDINVGLGLALIFFVISLVRQTNHSSAGKYLMYIMAGSALLTGCGWFASNINATSAVGKFRAIMALDDKHVPGDYALAGYEHLRKYYLSVDDNEGFFWAIKSKIVCGGYPQDYRAYAQFAIEGVPPRQRRASFDWLFSDLLSKVDSLQTFSADSLASIQKTEYLEVFLESYIDSYSLPERDGLGKAYAERWLHQFKRRFQGNSVIDFVREHTESVDDSPSRDIGSLRSIAGGIRSSPKLLTGVGIVMMMINEYRDAALVFERAYAVDPSDTKPEVYLAAAEFQCIPRNVKKIRQALDDYFRDPKYQNAARLNADDKQVRSIAENLRKMLPSAR